MEGARWNRESFQIDESLIGQFYDTIPIIILKPIELSNKNVKEVFYDAPVYRTPDRHNTTTKSGHSSNFVTHISLKTEKSPAHWIGRGVALLCQLNN